EGNEGAENEGAQNEGAQNEGAGARPERGSRDRHGVPAARRARQEPRAAAGFSRAAVEGGAARGRGALSAGGGAASGVALPSRRSIGDRALRSDRRGDRARQPRAQDERPVSAVRLRA